MKKKQSSLEFFPKYKIYSLVVGFVLFINVFSYAQSTGKVISGKDETPMPGVSILIKGTSTGTISDLDGNFSLNAASGSTLVISSIGFKNQEISITGQTNITITMDED